MMKTTHSLVPFFAALLLLGLAGPGRAQQGSAGLRERYAKRNVTLNPGALRMARVPQGAEVVRNPEGSAPMVILRLGRARLFFVPGVPREYTALAEGEVLPRIRAVLQNDPERVYRAFRDTRQRRRWLGDVDLTIRTAVPNKSMRVTWPDGTSVEWYFVPKGDAKTQVAVQHVKLADREAVDRMKVWWGERLAALETVLA